MKSHFVVALHARLPRKYQRVFVQRRLHEADEVALSHLSQELKRIGKRNDLDVRRGMVGCIEQHPNRCVELIEIVAKLDGLCFA